MVPQVLLETAQKSSGLILLAGHRYSEIDRTLYELTLHLREMRSTKGALILRHSPSPQQLNCPFLMVQYSEIHDPLVQKSLAETDCLIFQDMMDWTELEWALHLAEEGRMVITHYNSQSILSALHRQFCLWPAAAQHWTWRWSEVLTLMLSQTCIAKSGVESQFAHEIALVGPQTRALLRKGELETFENELQKASEKSGLVSLNQSLLQLLVRRKIDIKTAFETTRDPDDLDSLLKKVGI